ncbi:hypothetical protein O3M35_002451 [Rhynocoris fuscipes]|uniref:Uncharacterized protein n=1 Tax=Rhynocoris fuscipes TaxID=488301 RepID=A0AAW1CPF7_9HEMI
MMLNLVGDSVDGRAGEEKAFSGTTLSSPSACSTRDNGVSGDAAKRKFCFLFNEHESLREEGLSITYTACSLNIGEQVLATGSIEEEA